MLFRNERVEPFITSSTSLAAVARSEVEANSLLRTAWDSLRTDASREVSPIAAANSSCFRFASFKALFCLSHSLRRSRNMSPVIFAASAVPNNWVACSAVKEPFSSIIRLASSSDPRYSDQSPPDLATSAPRSDMVFPVAFTAPSNCHIWSSPDKKFTRDSLALSNQLPTALP